MAMTFKQVMPKQMSLSFLFFADVFILSKDSVFTLTNASARHTFEKNWNILVYIFLVGKKQITVFRADLSRKYGIMPILFRISW